MDSTNEDIRINLYPFRFQTLTCEYHQMILKELYPLSWKVWASLFQHQLYLFIPAYALSENFEEVNSGSGYCQSIVL